MTLQERLRLVRGSMGYREFAQRVGCSFNSVRRYELGLVRVPAEYVEAVCRAFNISADWLLLGAEAPTEAALQHLSTCKEGTNGRRYVMIDGEKVRIICVPVLNRIPAGPPAEMMDDMPVGFGLEGAAWVPDPHDENAYGLVACGDSMEPIIRDGETIIVSPRRRLGFVSGLAVVRIPGGEVCVKYVRRRPHRVEIASANPHYPTMHFAPQEVEVLGAVVGIVRE